MSKLDNNILIAEFMGLEKSTKPIGQSDILIADVLATVFMGLEKSTKPIGQSDKPLPSINNYIYNGALYTPDGLQYKYSWDWLMPVVIEIERLGYGTSFKTHYVRINPKDGGYNEAVVQVNWNEDGWNSYCGLDGCEPEYQGDKMLITKKQAIYKAVVRFIEWYNKENNNN